MKNTKNTKDHKGHKGHKAQKGPQRIVRGRGQYATMARRVVRGRARQTDHGLAKTARAEGLPSAFFEPGEYRQNPVRVEALADQIAVQPTELCLVGNLLAAPQPPLE